VRFCGCGAATAGFLRVVFFTAFADFFAGTFFTALAAFALVAGFLAALRVRAEVL
jgi:hypothetical protein